MDETLQKVTITDCLFPHHWT